MFKPYVIKRAIFMFVIMFPTLLILEYTGNSSLNITSILAAVTAGISVVIFPDPDHLKRIKEAEKNEKSGK